MFNTFLHHILTENIDAAHLITLKRILAYADDLAIIAESTIEAEWAVNAIVTALAKYNMSINKSKCEAIVNTPGTTGNIAGIEIK